MTAPPMVSLTIEGRPVTVPAGTSIIEAAKTVGVLIPHYCYHPALPVVGSCRMCLVEVEKAPKLAPACATAVAEGQVIHVHSEPPREARKGVLEMLLINHPLDCPICDKSGECELQDYTFQEGRKDSRLRDPKRFMNPVEDFGGDVLYVPNRCILCSRCVRFMEDVAEDAVLNVTERGDRAYIGKFEGKDLTHPWAGNVIDICPVGALLSKDFLNKSRSWEVDRNASICTGCSQGCNMSVETRDNMVVRLRPRPNTDVNQYFLCDHGRLDYRHLNRLDRLEQPMIAGASGGGLEPVDWDVAIARAASLLGDAPVHLVASANLSNESLWLLSRVVELRGGRRLVRIPQGPEAPLPGAPDLALRADRAANGYGADLLGYARSDDPFSGLQAGDTLILADHELTADDLAAAAKAKTVIVLGTTLPEALANVAVALPITNHVEEEGTFTNLRGRVQRYLQARAAPALARPAWFTLADLLGALGEPVDFLLPAAVFDAMASSQPAFAGLTYDGLGLHGAVVAGATAGAGA